MDDARALSQSDVIMGTPAYMAPEQAAGQNRSVGPLTDVHALGVILYEALTGRTPYRGATVVETLEQIRDLEPVPPGRLQPGIPRDLQTITLRCLHKDPWRRYAAGDHLVVFLVAKAGHVRELGWIFAPHLEFIGPATALDLAEDLRRFLAREPIAARPLSMLGRWRNLGRRHRALVTGVAAVMAALLLGTAVSILFALGEASQRIAAEHNARRADENARKAHASRREALGGMYQARVAAAQRALGDRDFAEAALNLEAAPSELRGWEWRLIHQRLAEEAPAVVPAPDPYRPVFGFVPAGRRMLALVGLKDRFALIDARTGHLERELPKGKSALALPTAAGISVLIYQPGAPLSLVDEAGRVSQTRQPLGPDYVSWAVNPAFTRVAASAGLPGPENRLELRDLPSGELRRVLPGAGKHLSLAFSPDGAWLAAACSDQIVRLWQIIGGNQTIQMRGHQGEVRGAAFSPDGQTLLSWGADGTLRQWQVATGKAIDIRHTQNRAILTAAYSPDGRYILSGGEDRIVRLWRTQSSEALATLPGHVSFVASVAFHPDGENLVSYGWDRVFRFWPLPMRSDPRVLRGHTSYVYSVACSPDERWLAGTTSFACGMQPARSPLPCCVAPKTSFLAWASAPIAAASSAWPTISACAFGTLPPAHSERTTKVTASWAPLRTAWL